MKPYLSVIIPAYNEAARLPSTLEKLAAYLQEAGFPYEIIVIDDGSDDQTAEASLKQHIQHLKVHRLPSNQGKGAALKEGIQLTEGDLVLMSDADGSTPIQEFEKLRSLISEEYPIVIGTRNDPALIKTRQSFFRSLIGRVFNELVKSITGLPFYDTQCGFKLFQGEIARQLFAKLKVDGFAFDVELLYLAKSQGLGVEEVAVIWENDPRSKVQVWRDPIIMFAEILRLRWMHS